jgi:hypothetical protein
MLAVLGYPVLAWSPFVGLGLALVAGALAGSALALGRGRRLPALLGLSLAAALVDQALLLALDLAGGASPEALDPWRNVRQLGLEALGILALLALGPTPGARGTLGYALFSISRLGPARLDVWWLVDAAGALSTFMRLRVWRPGQAPPEL